MDGTYLEREIEVGMGERGLDVGQSLFRPETLHVCSIHLCSSLITRPKISLEFRISVYNISINHSVGLSES